jgi:hypothetical protein
MAGGGQVVSASGSERTLPPPGTGDGTEPDPIRSVRPGRVEGVFLMMKHVAHQLAGC